jgi:large subunit ribosomal protein L25
MNARPFQAKTKGELRQLRLSGRIPISLQHRGEPTQHLQVEAQPLEEFIRQHGQSTMLEIALDSGVLHSAVVHDTQRHPVTHRLLQVTLQQLGRDELLKIQVPLAFHGVPQAVSDHSALLQHQLEQVEIRCLPRDLPEQISVDVSGLKFGDSLRVSDLVHDARCTILTPGDTVVASLSGLSQYTSKETEENSLGNP